MVNTNISQKSEFFETLLKGGVENFNGLIRTIYSKSFDFATIKQEEIDKQINKINEIYWETLGFHSAKERYNELSLINWVL